MFDKHDQLLYVGVTLNPSYRFHDHRGNKPWWPEIVTIRLEHFPNRLAVLRAEREAIQKEAPKYNITHGNHSPGAVPLRNVRIEDDLWLTALALARQRGETLSDVIRRALREYIGVVTRHIPEPRP